jgi:Transposase IS116/IS110/IS902 family
VASRLYRTTRPLYLQVCRILDQLGLATIGGPTTALLALLVAWIRQTSMPGYLCLDDVVVEKAFAKRLQWAGWTYSFAKKRKVYGMHVVVLLWCSADGGFRIPVAFRLWRPKRSCAPAAYQTKLQLAAGCSPSWSPPGCPSPTWSWTPTTPPAGSPAWPVGSGSAGLGPCHPRPRWSGVVGGSRSPSWPGGCGWPGGRGLGCARWSRIRATRCWVVEGAHGVGRSVRDQPVELLGRPAQAAKLLGEVADMCRFSTKHHLAAHTGTAPLQASSGRAESQADRRI